MNKGYLLTYLLTDFTITTASRWNGYKANLWCTVKWRQQNR